MAAWRLFKWGFLGGAGLHPSTVWLVRIRKVPIMIYIFFKQNTGTMTQLVPPCCSFKLLEGKSIGKPPFGGLKKTRQNQTMWSSSSPRGSCVLGSYTHTRFFVVDACPYDRRRPLESQSKPGIDIVFMAVYPKPCFKN